VNWRERQALPGPRARFFFASVVPAFADAETGEVLKGLPEPRQKWKFVWPKKGVTFRYHQPQRLADGTYSSAPRPATRLQRETWRDFDVVDPVAA
jgi:hypothetical protein